MPLTVQQTQLAESARSQGSHPWQTQVIALSVSRS
jgi:hypothetical protein